jgi:hypothetical protein
METAHQELGQTPGLIKIEACAQLQLWGRWVLVRASEHHLGKAWR